LDPQFIWTNGELLKNEQQQHKFIDLETGGNNQYKESARKRVKVK